MIHKMKIINMKRINLKNLRNRKKKIMIKRLKIMKIMFYFYEYNIIIKLEEREKLLKDYSDKMQSVQDILQEIDHKIIEVE